MQCKEYSDANSELFKEEYDEALHENTCEIEFCDLISVFPKQVIHIKTAARKRRPFLRGTDEETRIPFSLAKPTQWGRLRYEDTAFLASSKRIHAYVEKE